MKKIVFLLGVLATELQMLMPAFAAPMDTFLSANQSSTPGEVQIETAYDLMNSKVDVFHLRDKDSNYSGTNVGDYHGAHIRVGMAATSRMWLEGAFWKRGIDYRSDYAKINTWQLAAQYKVFEGVGYQPNLALRAGVWGDYSSALTKSSPSRVGGETLNSVSVSHPKDVQYQLDLIGTSRILNNTELTLFSGVGASRVSVNSVDGTATYHGCHYNLDFGPTEVIGTVAQLCNASVVIDRFTLPNSISGINVNQESQYNASYYHGGAMLKWNENNWQVRAGYQYQYVNRSRIDDIIRSRGGVPYKSNHTLTGEVMYKLFAHTAVFMRAQYLKNQFTGEIPFVYNTLTASRFDKHYGIFSTGLVMTF